MVEKDTKPESAEHFGRVIVSMFELPKEWIDLFVYQISDWGSFLC